MEKRQRALQKVEADRNTQLIDGMKYFYDLQKQIEKKKEENNKRERARSAKTYQSLRFQLEFLNAGGTWAALNKTLKKPVNENPGSVLESKKLQSLEILNDDLTSSASPGLKPQARKMSTKSPLKVVAEPTLDSPELVRSKLQQQRKMEERMLE